jgi:hypothetical protein
MKIQLWKIQLELDNSSLLLISSFALALLCGEMVILKGMLTVCMGLFAFEYILKALDGK